MNHPVAAVVVGLLVFASLAGFALAGVAPTNLLSVAPPALPTGIQHVIVIYFENQPLSAVMADGGYLSTLPGLYAHATEYYAICHPSEPNYLTGFSDSDQGRCGTDAYATFSGSNLGSELTAKGESWAWYAQSMTQPCTLSNSGAYVVHHDAAAFFDNIITPKSYCDEHILPLGPSVGSAFLSGSPPAFAWIQPSGQNVNTISVSDGFAQQAISAWSSQSWWSSTVVLITYDESAQSDTSCPGVDGLSGTCGGHVYFVAVSPLTKGGGAYSTPSDHFSLYATVSWLLGLPAAAKGTAMKGLFGSAPAGLQVSLTASPANLQPLQSTTLTAAVSGGTSPYAYSWTGLPPGCASTSQKAVCTDVPAGNYTPEVTVTDSAGASGSATTTVTVSNTSPPPPGTQTQPFLTEAQEISLFASGMVGAGVGLAVWKPEYWALLLIGAGAAVYVLA